MILERFPELLLLPREDIRLLIHEILEKITADPATDHATAEKCAELRRKMEDCESDLLNRSSG
jgi:hypothetical protein